MLVILLPMRMVIVVMVMRLCERLRKLHHANNAHAGLEGGEDTLHPCFGLAAAADKEVVSAKTSAADFNSFFIFFSFCRAFCEFLLQHHYTIPFFICL